MATVGDHAQAPLPLALSIASLASPTISLSASGNPSSPQTAAKSSSCLPTSTSAVSTAPGRSSGEIESRCSSAAATACSPIADATDRLQRPPSPLRGKASDALATAVHRASSPAQVKASGRFRDSVGMTPPPVRSGPAPGPPRPAILGHAKSPHSEPRPVQLPGVGNVSSSEMTRSAERKLIEKAAAGEQASAERLIKAHQGSLYAYMLRLSGSPEMAEDIVQDAFVRVLTHLDRFDPRFRFSTWLFTIAKRLYVNANQKHKPHYDSEIVGAWGGSGEQPVDPMIRDEVGDNARNAIQTALHALSPDQREVILLFHQQNWPISSIAGHLGMPEGTVKSHLHRGRQKMRACLTGDLDRMPLVEEVWT